MISVDDLFEVSRFDAISDWRGCAVNSCLAHGLERHRKQIDLEVSRAMGEVDDVDAHGILDWIDELDVVKDCLP